VEAGKVELECEPVRINKLVEQAAKIIRGTARNQGISIRIALDDGDPVALADERRVKQVLFNLLTNAVKYSPEGSGIEAAVESDAEWITVRVTDQGVGIAADDQERIFEEFVRVGPRGAHPGGAGLGLPLSRQLVLLHGGQMGLRSEPGEGSSFWFTLPVAQPQGPVGQPGSIADIHADRYLHGN
jgi:signal transduction histidine kinase